jgi:hypothetical protein
MKEFNLEAALNGEPICASEQKCYVVREVTKFLDDKSVRKFAVIFPDSSAIAEIWSEDDFKDDIAMWEEAKKQISIEDLPKPFHPEIGDEFFYLSVGTVQYCSFYSDINADLMRNGQCFSTREDAQKWLDFMKSMM